MFLNQQQEKIIIDILNTAIIDMDALSSTDPKQAVKIGVQGILSGTEKLMDLEVALDEKLIPKDIINVFKILKLKVDNLIDKHNLNKEDLTRVLRNLTDAINTKKYENAPTRIQEEKKSLPIPKLLSAEHQKEIINILHTALKNMDALSSTDPKQAVKIGVQGILSGTEKLIDLEVKPDEKLIPKDIMKVFKILELKIDTLINKHNLNKEDYLRELQNQVDAIKAKKHENTPLASAPEVKTPVTSRSEVKPATAPQKGVPLYTKQQEAIINTLVDSLKSIALEASTNPKLNAKHRFTNISNRHHAGVTHAFEFSSDHKELNALIEPLLHHLNEFIKTQDLNKFRLQCNETLKNSKFVMPSTDVAQPSIQQKRTLFIAVHDAVVFLFRAFFRLFDYLVTGFTWSSKLMRDTETPFAKKLTGQSHFFEYYPDPIPQTPKELPKSPAVLEKLNKDFAEGIQKLEQVMLTEVSKTPALG